MYLSAYMNLSLQLFEVNQTLENIGTSQLHWSTGSRPVRVSENGWPELCTGGAVWPVNSKYTGQRQLTAHMGTHWLALTNSMVTS